jgi:hypothetical protein
MATKAQWDGLVWHEKTARGGYPSQYNPHRYGSDPAVRQLELKCFRKGILIEPRGARYMHLGHIVGVCSGEETEYVFAECSSGFVHGRPISTIALKKMGVAV